MSLKSAQEIKIIFFLVVIMTFTVQCSGNKNSSNTNNADSTDAGSLSSLEFVKTMGAGWNLGNTLDAHWNRARPWISNPSPAQIETLWGNPVTTKAMINFLKEEGFTTIRIPVTWYIFTGQAPDYIIDSRWMDRVQEVVDYVIDNGMFCILNAHHEDYVSGSNYENGWFRLYDREEDRALDDSEKERINSRFAKIWAQIAERFKNYSEYLIFEGINEPRTEGLNNISYQMYEEQNRFLNELLQTFINTVRDSGGKNYDRHLMVTPYFASVGMSLSDSDGRIRSFLDRNARKLRVTDPRDRLIVSLHYYEPWGFVTAPDDSQWHSWYFDMDVGSVSSNINNVYRIIRENFILYGIPVIMGETGAIRRIMPDGNSNDAERVKWAQYYISGLKQMGVPVIIWDDGGMFKLFDRSALRWEYPEIAAAIVNASK
uniref:Endoglucanase n=1 Tax=uncultured bacterium contig00053 TaxID=1181537 RepID=A0A806KB31_9BACT|nr:endoglucanase [uncultured bacterium contig00053]